MTSLGPPPAPGRRATEHAAPSPAAVGATGQDGSPDGPDAPGRADSGLICVRRAAPGDCDALTRMFERCSPQTRYRRFHGLVKAMPSRYLTEALSGGPFHHALVACPDPDLGLAPRAGLDLDLTPAWSPAAAPGRETRLGRIVALASCRVTDEGAAELGLLIEDAWQRRGLGTRLLRDLIAHASRTGMRALEAQLLAEQAWITGMLRPYGPCRLRSTWNGVLNVTVRLAS